MNYLLDTCVLSEARKKRPNPGLAAWLDGIDELRLAISVLTLGEIQQGIAQLPDNQHNKGRKQTLQTWLDQQLIPRFEGRILAAHMETALEWGVISGQARQNGSPTPIMDALLAATAITHNQVFVTRNIGDFERFPLKLLNPWT